ncbi:mitochondrial protein C2orf69 homolog [Ornithodoros turicata]
MLYALRSAAAAAALCTATESARGSRTWSTIIIVLFGLAIPTMIRKFLCIIAPFLRGTTSTECVSSVATQHRSTMVERFRLEGLPGKFNDVILKAHNNLENVSQLKQVVVFFGGDTQDFPEAMELHRDNRRYAKWNLEYMADLMFQHFPQSHCIVIRANRLQFRTFSCYDNFVESSDIGAPTHEFSVAALEHLQKLIASLAAEIEKRTSPRRHVLSASLLQPPLVLVGFSKGAVVLNQFLYSFKALEHTPDDDLSAFVSRVANMVWLDGGHSGGSNTWVTKEVILKCLLQLDIKVDIHVTPYQIRCASRPWIGKEEKLFYDTLKRLGVDVRRTVHYDDATPCIELHFQLLEDFMPLSPQPPQS